MADTPMTSLGLFETTAEVETTLNWIVVNGRTVAIHASVIVRAAMASFRVLQLR